MAHHSWRSGARNSWRLSNWVLKITLLRANGKKAKKSCGGCIFLEMHCSSVLLGQIWNHQLNHKCRLKGSSDHLVLWHKRGLIFLQKSLIHHFTSRKLPERRAYCSQTIMPFSVLLMFIHKESLWSSINEDCIRWDTKGIRGTERSMYSTAYLGGKKQLSSADVLFPLSRSCLTPIPVDRSSTRGQHFAVPQWKNPGPFNLIALQVAFYRVSCVCYALFPALCSVRLELVI